MTMTETPTARSRAPRGIWHRALLRGALAWGVPFAVLYSVVVTFFEGDWVHFWRLLGTMLVVGPAVGLFFGLGLWLNERHRAPSEPNRE